MRRLVLIAGLLLACRPGEPVPPTPRPAPPRPAPAPATDGEPSVRVGLVVNEPSATLSGSGPFELRTTDGRPLATGRPGDVWTVANRAGTLAWQGPDGRSGPAGAEAVRVVALDGFVSVGERTYRGEVEVEARAGERVTVVNILPIEEYLRGVVPREIGARPEAEIEAVKAQAVAARTYAIGNLRGRARLGFDFYATTQDQVYGGVADEDPIATRAIDATRGVVAMWRGEPILAYYSSTCGGRTANIEDAWPWRAALPYLRSISDTDDAGAAYCEFSNRYRWSTRWTRRELLDVLAQTLPAHFGAATPRRVDDVRVAARSSSGTVSVDLQADGRSHRLRADSTRWVLRPAPGPGILNSARITGIETEMGDDGVHALHVAGMGWGHGVGMCQIGAIGRARAGHSYSEILKAYYTGIDLNTLY